VSGGQNCQGRDDDGVAGTFLAQSGDCLKQFDLPGLFDDNHFIALVAPIVQPSSNPFPGHSTRDTPYTRPSPSVKMTDRRSGDESRAKRQKTETDPASNPYLAHMNHGDDNSYSNGRSNGRSNGSGTDGLTHFKRHSTTSALAAKAEDGPSNPFNGNNLSERYFGILKTRRNLPVHAQRYVPFL
jgi:hypothetical protein